MTSAAQMAPGAPYRVTTRGSVWVICMHAAAAGVVRQQKDGKKPTGSRSATVRGILVSFRVCVCVGVCVALQSDKEYLPMQIDEGGTNEWHISIIADGMVHSNLRYFGQDRAIAAT